MLSLLDFWRVGLSHRVFLRWGRVHPTCIRMRTCSIRVWSSWYISLLLFTLVSVSASIIKYADTVMHGTISIYICLYIYKCTLSLLLVWPWLLRLRVGVMLMQPQLPAKTEARSQPLGAEILVRVCKTGYGHVPGWRSSCVHNAYVIECIKLHMKYRYK